MAEVTGYGYSVFGDLSGEAALVACHILVGRLR